MLQRSQKPCQRAPRMHFTMQSKAMHSGSMSQCIQNAACQNGFRDRSLFTLWHGILGHCRLTSECTLKLDFECRWSLTYSLPRFHSLTHSLSLTLSLHSLSLHSNPLHSLTPLHSTPLHSPTNWPIYLLIHSLSHRRKWITESVSKSPDKSESKHVSKQAGK